MVEEIIAREIREKETITSTVFCVNTNCAYVYELLNGDIITEKKISVKV